MVLAWPENDARSQLHGPDEHYLPAIVYTCKYLGDGVILKCGTLETCGSHDQGYAHIKVHV